MGCAMRGICCFLVAFSLTFFVGLAWSADYDVRATSGSFYTRNVTPATQVRSQTTFAARAMVPASPVIYTAREVVYSRSTAASLLRFAASPAGLLTTFALRAFFDWFETNGNEILPDGTPVSASSSGSCPANSVYYSCNHYAGNSLGAALAAERSYYTGQGYTGLQASISADYVIINLDYVPNGQYNMNFYVCALARSSCPYVGGPYSQSDLSSSASIPADWGPVIGSNDSTSPAAMSNDDFFDSFESSPYASDSDTIGDIFKDGRNIPFSTPEIQDASRALRDELAAKDGTDPLTLPAPSSGTSADPSNPDAPLTSPDGWDAAPSSGGASNEVKVEELPVFCTWASIVCDWIGWTQEPLAADTPPSLPVESAAPGTWDSGLGSGSCPAPIVVSALSASVSLSWQPACDFVSILRPILIAFAGIAAALILLGQRAGGAG